MYSRFVSTGHFLRADLELGHAVQSIEEVIHHRSGVFADRGVCIIVRERGRNQVALIGAFGPPVTPTCSNSNGVNPVIKSRNYFYLAPYEFKQMGATGDLNEPIRIA
ncbi:hypothetical protein Y032_0009g794 [Ancylostoma ceylanicum]|uniref:Uncharacterized protein n=1 Tax=Ancylostoma ceylanicum TaxID=53326 RepID=A0A016VKP9_9BILA|nr:hypothetical protein Y032_0009g794 [Ancylostoma ceylanicum]